MRREQVINWDPDILSGIPVFAGTRVPVQTLIDYLKAGDSLDDFLDGFPSVSREQAQAFLELALDSALAQRQGMCVLLDENIDGRLPSMDGTE
jgi:uncharacterized protein (DUF433 family)